MTELKPRYLIPESHLEFKALRLEWKFAENVPSVQLHRHKIRFYAFLEATEKKGPLAFSRPPQRQFVHNDNPEKQYQLLQD